jgi:hypothetical protein
MTAGPLARRLIEDAVPRRLVLGCHVDRVVVKFPHQHPETNCAVCAYLTARVRRDQYEKGAR